MTSQKETYQGGKENSEERSSLRKGIGRTRTGRTRTTLDAAHGHWQEILPDLGVPHRALNGKHQPCPACGGKDRFRFTDRHGDGDYFCSGCGAGKGVSLIAKVNGWDYAEAAKRIDELIETSEEQACYHAKRRRSSA